jgi:hypothetical protein
VVAGSGDGVDGREGVFMKNDIAGFDEVVGVDVEELGSFAVAGYANEHAFDGAWVKFARSGGFLDMGKGEATKNSCGGKRWMLGEDSKVG